MITKLIGITFKISENTEEMPSIDRMTSIMPFCDCWFFRIFEV